MVVRDVSPALGVPAVVVPDERSWAMWGQDLAASGYVPAVSAEEAAAVWLPAELPEPLAEPLMRLLHRVPAKARTVTLPSPLTGRSTQDWLVVATQREAGFSGNGDASPGAEMHGHQHSHGDGDAEHGAAAEDGREGDACSSGHHSADREHHRGHEDDGTSDEPWANNMMPIGGTPSRDGLVMEDVEVVLGPLGSPLPGGLVAEIGLDGEVVCRCELTRTLEVRAAEGRVWRAPDPLAPAAWQVAFDYAFEAAVGVRASEATRRQRVAAVEVERALSHFVNLRELGRVLGWQQLIDAAARAVEACGTARAAMSTESAAAQDELAAARRQAEKLASLLDGSRRLRWRTAGRALLTADRLSGIPGPVARAAGARVDARLGDSLYEALGFELTTMDAGDAQARTVLSASEARVALRLAATAVSEQGSGDEAGPLSGCVESPRGPVQVTAASPGWRGHAPGAGSLLEAVQEAVTGEVYSRALVGLVSFDLSPWRVPA